MNKSLLCRALLFTAIALPARAQIINPSFETGDFTGWSLAGTPSIQGAPPTVPNGNFQALINSTGAGGATGVYAPSNAVSASALDMFLGVTLPATNGPAINGEAISQTFTLAQPEKLTFSIKYASRELNVDNSDGTGYVVNGVYHFYANANTPGQSMGEGVGFLDSGLPVETLSINLPAGVNTIAFVAYNTLNGLSPSGLFIDDLTLTPLVTTTHFASTPGLDPNQLAIAHYIDAHSAHPSPTLAKIITTLDDAPSAQVLAQDLNELSPESLGIFRNIGIDNATFFSEDVNNHLANLRDGLTGFDTSGLTVNNLSQSPQAQQIQRHLAGPKEMVDPKEMSDAKELVPPATTGGYAANRWSVWLAGDVTLAQLNSNEDIEHEGYTTESGMLGVDYRLDDHWTVGALVGFGHTDVNLDNEGGTGTADSYFPGIYASYVDGGWYANGLAAYNYNTYTEDRHVDLPGLSGFNHGAFDGNEYLTNLTGGYEFQSGSWKYGPFAGLQYVHLELNSFSEDGVTPLYLQSQSDDSLRSQLGFEARYVAFVSDVALVPHASVAWQHEFLNNDHSITGAFVGNGGGSFTVQTEDIGEDSAFIDVGLDATVCRDVTLFVDYQTEAGETNFYAQSVLGGVRVGF